MADGLLPYRPARAKPYFYTEHQIRQFLSEAKTRSSIDPLRSRAYDCLSGLLAVTALRLGEALNLRTEDLNWAEGGRSADDLRGQVRRGAASTSTCLHLYGVGRLCKAAGSHIPSAKRRLL